jgi:cyclic pyranopterin phosphate synthase
MVDISEKLVTHRVAVAHGKVYLPTAAYTQIRAEGAKKGDIVSLAEFAGITAAKKTSDLIPLCHQIALSSVQVDVKPNDDECCFDVTACA